MSVLVMSWVFAHSRAAGNDRLVLLAIADRANDEGTDAWPSLATIAAKVLASERTVRRCLRSLEQLGELEVTIGGGRASNRYRVVMHTPDNLSGGQPVRGDTGVRGARTPVSGDTSLDILNTPQPPASGGRDPKADHCERHTRHRASCAVCVDALLEVKARPAWCGSCDEETRLVWGEDDMGPRADRCRSCHPLTQ